MIQTLIGRVLGNTYDKYMNSTTIITRKSYLIRCAACIIIIFTQFCCIYWNLLQYIDFPCAPLFSDELRTLLHLMASAILILWLFYKVIIEITVNLMIKICSSDEIFMKNRIRIIFLDAVIDFAFSIFFLLYALNLIIEYANGMKIEIKHETYIAIGYLLYNEFSKSFLIMRCRFEQTWRE